MGVLRYQQFASNLLAFSSKMVDIAATGTDKRSVRAIAGDNTSRAAKSRGFYSNSLAIAVDNVLRNNIKQLASARNTCFVAFQQIVANGTEPLTIVLKS